MAPHPTATGEPSDETSPLLGDGSGSTANVVGGGSNGQDVEGRDGDGGGGGGDDGRQRFLLCLRLTPLQLSWARAICGYLLIINAGLLFTLANVVQKIVAPQLDFWHLLAYRAIVQLVVMFSDAKLRAGASLLGHPKKRLRVVLQGFLGGCLLLCIFIAVKLVPLGNASAIFFCTPVFTFAFAVVMLRERMGGYRFLISVFMIAGVLLITRPPFLFDDGGMTPPCPEPPHPANATCTFFKSNSSGNGTSDGGHHPKADDADVFSVPGYMCAVAVPLLSAVVSILTRQLKDIRASVLMFWFGVGAVVVGFGGLFATGNYEGFFAYSPLEFTYIAGIIVLGIAGNVSYTFAVRWVSPSKGNVFRSFEVILNYVLQLLLEHTAFHFSSVFGICFLLLAVVFIAAETEVMERYSGRLRFL